ncbi:MAG: 23S rRNA (guanosine(2251)-2'-O)-methyltransferase RlmB [Clostridiales bacterium]|nr:23S rRNA (guanosine(2251)-2'-O)-methyltransferase RlmB [Clostridiales bacterium]
MENEYIVEGRNTVIEVLKSDREINKVLIQKGERNGSINDIIKLAKNRGLVIVETEKNKLDQISLTKHHQGVIVYTAPQKYVEVEDILKIAEEKGEQPFLVILDGIEDPHNLGSIVRTAEIAGVHGIIIPKRRTALVTETVEKISVGATNYLPIARVSNLNNTIENLKKNNVWIIGTDMDARDLHYNTDLSGGIALVIGSEGKGMSRLVKENCDILIKIPMKGHITSLNASVSAGISIYEVVRQRDLNRKKNF